MNHPRPPLRRLLAPGLAAAALVAVAAGVGCSGPAPLLPRPASALSGEALHVTASPLLPVEGTPLPAGLSAALTLSANDRRFGGWSGLSVRLSADGPRLTAISDRGYWLEAVLRPGLPLALDAPRLGRLSGLDGAPLLISADRDAEDLLALPDGGWLVSFERHHRLWHYPPADPPFSAAPRVVPPPPGLDQAPYNGGIEALAMLPDGRLLAAVEGSEADQGARIHVGTPDGRWLGAFTLPLDGGMRPTALTVAGGRLLVLERGFSLIGGFAARVRDLGPPPATAHGVLDGPVILALNRPPLAENFEGIAALPAPSATSQPERVFLLTDDNFSGLQQTLLLEFTPPPAP